jgi:hypothetical protein
LCAKQRQQRTGSELAGRRYLLCGWDACDRRLTDTDDACEVARALASSALGCDPGALPEGEPILRAELDPARARTRPSDVLATINSRSNSARPPSTVSMSRTGGVVVSAQASPSERKVARRSATAARTFSRSRVERANRSRRVTRSTSPTTSAATTRPSCARSECAREAVSLNTLLAPAAISSATCASTLWPSVDTLA